MEVVMYDEANKQYYEEIESDKVIDSAVVALPAIVKQGAIVRRGKVFVPQKS